jgi:hypothetical protein
MDSLIAACERALPLDHADENVRSGALIAPSGRSALGQLWSSARLFAISGFELKSVIDLRAIGWPLLALNVSAGTARFRQLSGAFRKTYARREPF